MIDPAARSPGGARRRCSRCRRGADGRPGGALPRTGLGAHLGGHARPVSVRWRDGPGGAAGGGPADRCRRAARWPPLARALTRHPGAASLRWPSAQGLVRLNGVPVAWRPLTAGGRRPRLPGRAADRTTAAAPGADWERRHVAELLGCGWATRAPGHRRADRPRSRGRAARGALLHDTTAGRADHLPVVEARGAPGGPERRRRARLDTPTRRSCGPTARTPRPPTVARTSAATPHPRRQRRQRRRCAVPPATSSASGGCPGRASTPDLDRAATPPPTEGAP